MLFCELFFIQDYENEIVNVCTIPDKKLCVLKDIIHNHKMFHGKILDLSGLKPAYLLHISIFNQHFALNVLLQVQFVTQFTLIYLPQLYVDTACIEI